MHVVLRGKNLSATCKKIDGNWIKTQLFRPGRCAGPIFNLDGQLTCRMTKTAPPDTVLESWTFKEGAPEIVVALAQTTDGFLWVGGPSGLFRFDGLRFEPFRATFGDQLLSNNVYSLFAPPSGGLWVGYTFGGFSFLKNGRVKNYGLERGPSSGSVAEFAQDRDGIVWAATTSGLWRFDHSTWQHIGAEWNGPASIANHVAFDREGILWVIAGKTLLYLRPGTKRFEIAEKDLFVAGFPGVGGFTFDPDRFVLTDPGVNPTFKSSSDNAGDRPRAYPVLKAHSFQIIDRTNSVWIVSRDLIRFAPQGSLYAALQRVTSNNSEMFDVAAFPNAALVDQEGSIWFGSPKGVYRFSYSPLIKQDVSNLLGQPALAPDDHGGVWIGSMSSPLYHVSNGEAERLEEYTGWTLAFAYRAHDSTLWLGAAEDGLWHETLSNHRPLPDHGKWFAVRNALWQLTGRDWVQIDLPQEVADQAPFLQAITQDPLGGMWVSLGRHGLYRLSGGVWTLFGGRTDLPKSGVVCEFTDSLGRVWFGLTANQITFLQNDQVQLFGPGDGVRVGNITAISGRGPEIWIGGEFGLQQFDKGRFHNITSVNEELLRGISGIVETNDGDLWLNGLSGIFHIPRSEISEALKHPAYQVRGQRFGRREGLPGFAAQLRPLPTAIEATDGHLWFSVNNSVLWIDPAHAEHRVTAPAITIQSVAADDKTYEPTLPLKLPAHTSSVQFNYSAVSLSDPEAIRFRYKLQETDSDWHEAGEASPVTYRSLPPGLYHFVVGASDTNGNWSEKVATAEFTILPALYQTAWFRVFAIAAFLALLWAFYRLRLRHLATQFSLRLDERVRERTRIARELHDTLLQSFQGLILNFQRARNLLPARPDQAIESLDTALDRAEHAIIEGRDAIHDMRASAPADGNFAEEISALGEQLASEKEGSVPSSFRLVVEGSPKAIHQVVRDEIYRITREALRNAYGHAHARAIEAEISYEDKLLRVRIRDDGIGINETHLGEGRAGHYGLRGMRERATHIEAQLDVWSEEGAGTEIELRVPDRIAYKADGQDT